MKRAIVSIAAALFVATWPGLAAPHTAAVAHQAEAGPPSAEAVAAARAAVGEADLGRVVNDLDYAAQVLGHLDLLARAPDVYAEFGRSIETLRLRPLLALQRTEEVRATIDRLLAMRPDEAEQYRLPIYASLSIEDLGRFVALVEAAGRSVRGTGWSTLRELLDRDFVWPVLHRLRREDRPAQIRLAGALFRIGWPGTTAAASDPLRMILLEDALDRGDRQAAAGFAAGLTSPGVLAPILILKRYDGLLPEAGDRFAPLRAALAAQERTTADAVARDGQNLEHRLDRVQHLRALGRNGDALALSQPQLRDPDASALSSEDGMWLVNEAAYALLDLGRPAEAARLMDGLTRLPVADHLYLISSMINQGEVLNQAGLHGDSLAHARLLERDFAQHASDYGDMWIRATIVCASASLGRSAEAAPALEAIRAAPDVNPAALMRAYLCLNDLDTAETLIVSRLEGDDPQEAVMALQDYALEPRRDQLVERLLAVRARPAVRAALERVARLAELPLARTYWGGF